MRLVAIAAASLLFALIAPAMLSADDWPQWRGPNRNGQSQEREWFEHWPEGQSPRRAWTQSVGKGHSCVSVSDGRAYTAGWDGERDTIHCFDAASGKPLWQQSYACRTITQWPGPRATPTVDRDKVYTLGQWGQLASWDAATGARHWMIELDRRAMPDGDYGFAWSPLVVGDLLILPCGSRGLAIRKRDGSIAWGDDKQFGACVSAVPYDEGGRTRVVVGAVSANRSSLHFVGIDTAAGDELWRSPAWPERWGAIGVDPVVHGGKLFVTSAQEHRQAARFTIAGMSLRQDWSTNRLASYTSGCVLIEGHLYLVDSRGMLKCIDWETGKERWSQRGFDERGTLIAARDKLLIQTGQSGELVVAAADASKYRELRRAKVFQGESATFTAPSLASDRIYCRSYEGEVVCLDFTQ
jgi:outer membrane protein assembly factor BamB